MYSYIPKKPFCPNVLLLIVRCSLSGSCSRGSKYVRLSIHTYTVYGILFFAIVDSSISLLELASHSPISAASLPWAVHFLVPKKQNLLHSPNWNFPSAFAKT